MASPGLSLQCDLLAPTAYLPRELADRIFATLADKSLQGFETPDVAIEAYRALESASNVDVFDKHYATCCLSPCPL